MSISKESERKLIRILSAWAVALNREIEEHGRGNSFGVVELAGKYHGLNKRDGYRIGKTRMSNLWSWLGSDGWGERPTYSDGRFYVPAGPAEAWGIRRSDGRLIFVGLTKREAVNCLALRHSTDGTVIRLIEEVRRSV